MTSPATTTDEIDLDQQRAIRREAGRKETPLRFGGQVIAVLPAELPIDVFAPIRNLNLDFALLFKQALDMSSANTDAASQRAATELVVDLLVSNPNLPIEVLDAIRAMAVALIGEDGVNAFMAQRPSDKDIGAFVKAVLRLYGVSLGEASRSSASSKDDGTTSTGTSSAGTDSTPEPSSQTPEDPDTSASAA